jgi:C4-dicarboxylate-specific signal transduction histidine kinase
VDGLGGTPLVGMCGYGEGGLSDDGVFRHTNAVISALVFGHELSQTAHVARENQALRRQGDALRTRTQAELERLVQERTAQLEAANRTLKAEVAERARAEQALHRYIDCGRP